MSSTPPTTVRLSSEKGEGPGLGALLQTSTEAAANAHKVEPTEVLEAIIRGGEERMRKRFTEILKESVRPDGEYLKVRDDVIELLRLRGYENVKIEELTPSLERWLERRKAVNAINERPKEEDQEATLSHKFVIETPFGQTGTLSLSSKEQLTPQELEYIETLTNALSTLRLRQQAEYYNPFLTDPELIRILDRAHEKTMRLYCFVCFIDTSGSTRRRSVAESQGRPTMTIPVITGEVLEPAIVRFNKDLKEVGPTEQGDVPGDAAYNYLFMAKTLPRESKIQAATSAIKTALRIQEELMRPKHEEQLLQAQGKVVLNFGDVDAQIIGKPTDESRKVVLTGECINTLARLEKRPKAGQILVIYDEDGIAEEALQKFKDSAIDGQEITIEMGLEADPSDPTQASELRGLTKKVRYALITLPKVKEPKFPEIGSAASESGTE